MPNTDKLMILKAVAGEKTFFLTKDNTWSADRNDARLMWEFLVIDWVNQAQHPLPAGTTQLVGEAA